MEEDPKPKNQLEILAICLLCPVKSNNKKKEAILRFVPNNLTRSITNYVTYNVVHKNDWLILAYPWMEKSKLKSFPKELETL